MKVVVTFAVEAECAGWLRRRRFEPAPEPGARRTRIGDAIVDIVTTGIGPACARGVQPVLERARPDICIAAGLSGALAPALGRSTVVAPRTIRSGEAGAAAPELVADPWLFEQARVAGATLVPALVSTDRILVRAREKAAWAAAADIVDMESYRVVAAARALGIPAAAVRSVSDVAGEDLPLDFNRFVSAAGELSRGRLALAVASRPWRTGPVVRFGRASLHAAAALVIFLDGYVERIAASWRRD